MSMAAATQSGTALGGIPILAIIFATYIMYRWLKSSRGIDVTRIKKLDADIDDIKKHLLLVSTETVPGHSIIKTLGYHEAMSPIEAGSDSDYRIAEREALLAFARLVIAQGANAAIGLRKTNAHYDQAGSQWRISRVSYSGTAVVVKEYALPIVIRRNAR